MDVLMNLKIVVAVLLIAAVPVYAQAKSPSVGRVSKRAAADGVPNWDVTASCRAAAEVAYPGKASERQKACVESETRTREKLAGDWSTFPAAERTRCVASIKWFSPTYTELVTCLEMYRQVKNFENSATPNKPR
jgi:hypothetical protein